MFPIVLVFGFSHVPPKIRINITPVFKIHVIDIMHKNKVLYVLETNLGSNKPEKESKFSSNQHYYNEISNKLKNIISRTLYYFTLKQELFLLPMTQII